MTGYDRCLLVRLSAGDEVRQHGGRVVLWHLGERGWEPETFPVEVKQVQRLLKHGLLGQCGVRHGEPVWVATTKGRELGDAQE